MLPLVDTPLIQYAVEEVASSGLRDVCIVTGRGKAAIEDHFDVSFELEYLLRSRNKSSLLATIERISSLVDISYVRQKEALGLGHAVLQARNHVGDSPFAVVLADDAVLSRRPCIRQLLDVYELTGQPVLGLTEVPLDSISFLFGAVKAKAVESRNGSCIYEVEDLVEKPKPEDAPSNLAIVGRYVLTPQIFDRLESLEPGIGGELQLTDALRVLVQTTRIYAVRIEGTRYDAGDRLGFLKATVEFALQHPELRIGFRQFLIDMRETWGHGRAPGR